MLATVAGFFLGFFIFLFILVCLIMVLLILIQKGRGGGLASAFGGAGGNTAFGAKTGDVLTWATSIVFGVFLLLAIILNLMTRQDGSSPTPVPSGPSQNSSLPTGGGSSQK
jgi:preprotein translocase subunit SecG